MNKVINIDQIKQALPRIDLLQIIEDGFAEYSKGQVVVPEKTKCPLPVLFINP